MVVDMMCNLFVGGMVYVERVCTTVSVCIPQQDDECLALGVVTTSLRMMVDVMAS